MFEYQRWFGFSLFLSDGANAVGRGGAYAITHADGHDEPATGFSVYPDSF